MHAGAGRGWGPEYEEAAETPGATALAGLSQVDAAGAFPGADGLRCAVLYPQPREFGAGDFIAGNIAWKTEVTSLMIFIRLQEFDYLGGERDRFGDPRCLAAAAAVLD